VPTFRVQLNVNVPGLGDRDVVQTGIVAPTIQQAIDQARATVVITVLAAQQTAPAP
jgi:hypothetical protein